MKKPKVGDIIEAKFTWPPNHVQHRGYDTCWEVVRVIGTSYTDLLKVELVRDRRSKCFLYEQDIRPVSVRPA
jgi:uncharacterized protein (UPF0179 family)